MLSTTCIQVFVISFSFMLKDHTILASKEVSNHPNIVSGQRSSTALCRILNSTFVDCAGMKLLAVPTCLKLLPANCSEIEHLNLGHNFIETIDGVFSNFSSLKVLKLNNNPVNLFKEESFIGLENLEKLYLNNGKKHQKTYFKAGTFKSLTSLTYINMENRETFLNKLLNPALCSLQQKVHTVIMNKMHVWGPSEFGVQFDFTSTLCFRNSSVRKLYFDENHLYLVKPEAMLNLRYLEFISAKRNNLIGDPAALVLTPIIHNLRYIDLSEQSVKFNSRKNLFTIDLKQNITFDMLPHLHTLKLDFTNGRIIGIECDMMYRCWANNTLKRFEITFLALNYVRGIIPCFTKLEYLDMRGARISELDARFLNGMPSLQVLYAGGALTPAVFSKRNSSILFKNNRKLQYLDLSNLDRRDFDPALFEPLKQLRTLDVSRNKLEGIGYIPSVTQLNISDNLFTELPNAILVHLQKTAEMYNRSGYLDITNNPLICSCATLPIIGNFMKQSLVHISHLHDGKLKCVMVSTGKQISIQEARNELLGVCQSAVVSVKTLASFYLFIIISTAISAVLYKHRWKLGFAFYKTKEILCQSSSSENNEDFIFDAFVSYSSKNGSWVQKTLVTNLEKYGYSLCLDYMHFVPGQCITDNIVKGVNASKYTLLIVSRAFVKTGWCSFEVRYAQAHFMESNQQGIIGIVFPDVLQKPIPQALNVLLNTINYIEIPNDEYGERLFWMRLRDMLGKPIAYNHERAYDRFLNSF